MVKIVTINVNGFGDYNKRKQIFMYCSKMNFDIVCMQETHSDKENKTLWRTQWGGKILFSHGDSQARGVAVLFKPQLNIEIGNTCVHNAGRYIITDITIEEKSIVLCSVYTPNNDSPEFVNEMFGQIVKHKYGDVIIAGDLNLVLNCKLDAINRKNNNTKALSALELYMQEAMIIDAW